MSRSRQGACSVSNLTAAVHVAALCCYACTAQGRCPKLHSRAWLAPAPTQARVQNPSSHHDSARSRADAAPGVPAQAILAASSHWRGATARRLSPIPAPRPGQGPGLVATFCSALT